VVILFDIDGTLIDAGGAGHAAMAAAMSELYGAPGRPQAVACAGRTDRAIMQDFFELHDVVDPAAHWESFSATFLKTLPVFLGQHTGRVLPGVTELLARIAALSHVETGLLTGNLRHAARIKLQHFGLEEYFYAQREPCGGFGDVHLDRNDVARDALLSVNQQRSTPVEASSIWIIGDTPNDVRCARAIGANVLAVATGTFSRDELQRTEPDLVLDDLSQCDAWFTRTVAWGQFE
jgi:phosphoglycolate phosphatase-like HAD superfamily hydrolase